MAEAGPDENVATGVKAVLDGSDSYDPDGQRLSFLWTLQGRPAPSALTEAAVEGKTTPAPSFVPDVPGTYVFQLVVNDGSTDSAPDTVEIQAFAAEGNIPPNARAGKDQYARVGTLVVLDGSGSFDPDDGPAAMPTFQWRFKSVPPGSLVSDLLDASQVSASFAPDVAGTYVLELSMYDGQDTDIDEVVVIAYTGNAPPNARAGEDAKAAPGDTVKLDGTGSFDPDEGPAELTYQWRFVYLPPGSTLTDNSIVQAGTAAPQFTPDVAGPYVLALTVSDGAEKDIDHVVVVVTTEPWVEVAPREGTIGTQFTLTGHNYEFGFSKGKLYMGKKTLKAMTWASQSIFILVKKPNPPASYDIRILPKKAKGGLQQTIWEPKCFTVRVPVAGKVTYLAAEGKYHLAGKFFGTKKGKIYLGTLACKVLSWSMNPATNESEATFLLPKDITARTFPLTLVNKVGSGRTEMTVPLSGHS